MRKFNLIFVILLFPVFLTAQIDINKLLKYNYFRAGDYSPSEVFNHSVGRSCIEPIWYDDNYVLDKIKEYNNLSKKHNISKIIVSEEEYMYFNNNRLDSVVCVFSSGFVPYRFLIEYDRDKIIMIEQNDHGDIVSCKYTYDEYGQLTNIKNLQTKEEQKYYYDNQGRIIKYEILDSTKYVHIKDSICYNDSLQVVEVYNENLYIKEKRKNKFRVVDSTIIFTPHSDSKYCDPDIGVYFFIFNKNNQLLRRINFFGGKNQNYFVDDYIYDYNENNQLMSTKNYTETFFLENFSEYIYQYENGLLTQKILNIYKEAGELQYQEIITYKYEYEKQ